MKMSTTEVHETFSFELIGERSKEVITNLCGIDVTVTVYRRKEDGTISTWFELWESASGEYIRSEKTLKEAIDWILI